MAYDSLKSQSLPPFDARAWLDHIPAPRRSPVANWFHQAVREGAHHPGLVLQAVRQVCHRRQRGGDTTDAVVVSQALNADLEGALAYAQHVIDYEALPYAARQQVKAERAFHYLKESMRGKATTEPQIAYLRKLGYLGTPPEDRAQASALIDELRHGRGRA